MLFSNYPIFVCRRALVGVVAFASFFLAAPAAVSAQTATVSWDPEHRCQRHRLSGAQRHAAWRVLQPGGRRQSDDRADRRSRLDQGLLLRGAGLHGRRAHQPPLSGSHAAGAAPGDDDDRQLRGEHGGAAAGRNERHVDRGCDQHRRARAGTSSCSSASAPAGRSRRTTAAPRRSAGRPDSATRARQPCRCGCDRWAPRRTTRRGRRPGCSTSTRSRSS